MSMKIFRMEVSNEDYIQGMGLKRGEELGMFRIYNRGDEKYLVQEIGDHKVIVWAKFEGDGYEGFD